MNFTFTEDKARIEALEEARSLLKRTQVRSV